MLRRLRIIIFWLLFLSIILPTAGLTWLRLDAGRPLEDWFDARRGKLIGFEISDSRRDDGQTSDFVTLTSDSGLSVSARVIRQSPHDAPLPVLLILGGHRTGSDAVDLFDDVGARAVVALDYPYHGPERVRGLVPVLKTVPLARQAFLDTPPAVSLVIDWLQEQAWVDPDRIVIIGASLGVPFAATSAARDKRISGVVLVHGAADNRLWLETQVARRIDVEILHRPLGTILHWLAYGPSFDTAERITAVSPRPVVIIGARRDERTPAGQAEALYGAAGDPRVLRWTEGAHVQPNRPEVLAELMAIAEQELPLLLGTR